MKLKFNECLGRENLEKAIRIDFHVKLTLLKTRKKKFEIFQTTRKSHNFQSGQLIQICGEFENHCGEDPLNCNGLQCCRR